MKYTSSRAAARNNNSAPFMKIIVHRLMPSRFSIRLALGLAAVFLLASVIFIPSSAQDGERTATPPVLESAIALPDKYNVALTKEGLSETDEAEPTNSNDLITATTYAFAVGTDVLEDMSSGTTNLVPAASDDGNSTTQNIGFDFWFDGVRFTQFGANANGFAKLGPAPTGASFTNSIATTANAPKIMAYWDDIWVGTNGQVHYKVVGAAPNRKLVIEWQNMTIPRQAAATTGAGTFQMWLYEPTHTTLPGVIAFVYGNGIVVNATNAGYSIGLQSGASTNFASVTTSTDTVSYVTANNTQTDAISAGKKYTFTPNVPLAPTGLTFAPVTAVSIQLNWTDNATNEVGYVIYRSLDGVNYTFLTQLAAGTSSFNDTAVLPSTTYFYQVYAVSEGALSTPALSGSQATAAVGNITSAATGNWSAPATWVGGVVPTASDNVTIANGHTVTIDSSNAFSVTVQSGGILEFEATTARTLTVGQFVTIASGGVFQTAATGTVTTHVLSVGTNLTNNGTLDFSTNADTAGAGITFTGAASNQFSGIGTTTDVRTITVVKGAIANVLELSPTNFTVRGVTTDVAGFLTLTSGTFKIDGTFTLVNRTFPGPTYTIPATGGIWLNNPNYTVAATASGSTTTNNGLFRVTQGIYNIGIGAGDQMRGGAGAVFTIEGGAVNVSGAFDPQSAVIYTQSAGTMNVGIVGNTVSNFGTFELFSTASSFIMSGGTINVINPSTGATKVDFRVNAPLANQSITGGMVVIGATGAPSPSTYNVVALLPSVTINPTMTMAVNAAAVFMRGSTVVNNGAITGIGASPRFDFGSQNSAMTYSGTGVFGTLAVPFGGVGVSANSTFLTTLSSPIICNRVNLFQGGFINSNQITLGNAGASTTVVQIGSTGLTTPGGSFDVSPVHNQGTGGQILLYSFETAPRTTGVEINPTRILTSINLIDNPNNVTIAGGDLTLSSAAAALVLTNGRLITGANTLILSSGTATVTRTNGRVDGNFRKTFAAAASKTFEVGTANGYSPVTVNATAGTFPAPVTVKAVQGPQPNIPNPTLALSRYWTLTGTGLTADLTFNYLDPADIPVTATEANFVIVKYDGMFTTPGGTVNTAGNSATITGVTSFSDWTLAEPGAIMGGGGVLQFSSPTYNVGEAGPTATITVNRTVATNGTVMVDFATVAGGTATGGMACGGTVDYVNTSGTLTFGDGVTSQTFPITICNDSLNEATETVNLMLSNPQGGATIGTQNTAVLSITDDDGVPSIAITSPSPMPEGNSGTTPFTFNVNLSASSGQIVTVNYQTADGTATVADNDYVPIPETTLTFTPGQTTQPVTVNVNGDLTVEPDENFFVNLSMPVNATISAGQGTGTIQNDDVVLPTLSIDDVRVTEGNSGTSIATFTVTLSSPTAVASVHYSTADGTATAGSDYVAIPDTILNFGAPSSDGGVQTRTINVTINGDLEKEPNETFFVNLSMPSGATIADGQGVGIIIDDDNAVVADFDDDRKTDFSVFRPSEGTWYVLQSTNNVTNYRQFGLNGDIPVPGDYDGDSVTDLAVFRPSVGRWYIEQSSNFQFREVAWGVSTDKPVQGYYDGDDKTDIAVFRDGVWYVLRSSDGTQQVVQFGAAGDKPAQGDYDGDGHTDFAVFRGGTWFVQTMELTYSQSWGTGTDKAVVGDFDGDGKADIAVFRPSNGTWYIIESLTGNARIQAWGTDGDIPVVGDYDADGTSDIAVFRPSNGTWYVLTSTNVPTDIPPITQHWGQAGDKPVPAAYVPEQ